MVMDTVMKIVVGRVVTMVVEIMEIMSCLMGRVAVMRAMNENQSRSLADRLVDYIDEALLRSISESDSNVDITVRRDEAKQEV